MLKAPDDPRVLAVLEEFRLIFKSVRRHFQSVEKEAGISGAQVWVLAEVIRQPGIKVNDLAHALAIHQSTASNLVERLERGGMILRRRDAQDQRIVRLEATVAGRRAAKRAPGPAQGVLPAALRQLGDVELDALKLQLSRVAALLPERAARGRQTPLSEI